MSNDDFNITFLSLEGYVEFQKHRYLYFVTSLLLYIFIVCCNCLVVWLICVSKTLHEPMYILIAGLLVNSVFGSTVIYPRLLVDLLSESHLVSYEACVFQAFLLYIFGGSEFSLLTAMAFDRYVSICNPLRYSSIITTFTAKIMLLVAWMLPAFETAISVILTTRLTLCEFTLNRIYCDNYSILKASCGDKTVTVMYGLFLLAVAIFTPITLTILSYIKILLRCLKSSKSFRRKAFQTCLPHFLIFIVFGMNTAFEVIQARLHLSIPLMIEMMLSLEYVVIAPLFNPIIYGMKMQEISKQLKKLWRRERIT